jgi:ATP adenylyltransferase
MDKLWAPWRSGYIKGLKKDKGCLFCRVSKSKKDKENFVFLNTRYSLGILNLYPYNNGHIMIAPKRHIKSFGLLTDAETKDLMDCLKKAQKLLNKILKPHGYNIGVNEGRIAGAGYDKHLHVHVVPRWRGDTNFMPVVFHTKVISQALASLYAELTKK